MKHDWRVWSGIAPEPGKGILFRCARCKMRRQYVRIPGAVRRRFKHGIKTVDNGTTHYFYPGLIVKVGESPVLKCEAC